MYTDIAYPNPNTNPDPNPNPEHNKLKNTYVLNKDYFQIWIRKFLVYYSVRRTNNLFRRAFDIRSPHYTRIT